MKISIRKIAFSAVVAAVYAALTMILAPISYGPLQFRLSEAMCILPFFFPFSVWGLFVGCILSNIISAYGIIDIIFGSMATLLAALCTMYIGRSKKNIISSAVACLPPVIANGLIIGAIIAAATVPDNFWAGFVINGLQVGLGELAVMYLIGFPLMILLPKTAVFKQLSKLAE